MYLNKHHCQLPTPYFWSMITSQNTLCHGRNIYKQCFPSPYLSSMSRSPQLNIYIISSTSTSVLINYDQAKHFVPWAEYPQAMFPDYCSGVFYIMSGKVKTNSVSEIQWKSFLLLQRITRVENIWIDSKYCSAIFSIISFGQSKD